VTQSFPRPGRIPALLIVTVALLAPRVSQACAVCSFRDDGTQRGFMIGTVIMTTLPFVVIGSILFFIRRHVRGAAQGLTRSSSSQS